MITFLEDALQLKTMPTSLLPLNLASVHDSEYVLFSDTCSCICLPVLRSAYIISIGWQEQDIPWNISGSVPTMPHSSPFSTPYIVDASKPIMSASTAFRRCSTTRTRSRIAKRHPATIGAVSVACGDRTCSWLHERVRKRPIVRGEMQGATVRRLPSQGRRLPVTTGFQLAGTVRTCHSHVQLALTFCADL
jgi:hypothetical protein